MKHKLKAWLARGTATAYVEAESLWVQTPQGNILIEVNQRGQPQISVDHGNRILVQVTGPGEVMWVTPKHANSVFIEGYSRWDKMKAAKAARAEKALHNLDKMLQSGDISLSDLRKLVRSTK